MRFTCLLICLILSAHAQKENNIWYFGSRAGVNFNTSPPSTLRDNRLTSYGAMSSICDTSGNLLFYTDGHEVRARDHSRMPNGTNLGAGTFPWDQDNTLIAPHPDTDSSYYIFSIQRGWEHTFQFAIVDMRKNGGLGDVTSKNNPIHNNSETVAGTFQRNGKDLWILEHGWKDTTFRVYGLTAAGFNTTPQVQKVGTRPTQYTSNMKIAPDGKTIALMSSSFVELFDFDNATGILSQRLRIDTVGDRFFQGVEFSPNNRFLYANSAKRGSGTEVFLLRYDLAAADVKASRTIIARTGKAWADMLIASDGNIYMSRNGGQDFLAQVSNPNSMDRVKIIDLFVHAWDYTGFHLPNFVRGYTPTVNFSDICKGAPIQFELSSGFTITKAIWDFDDGTPVVDQLTPQHTYTKPGVYNLAVEYTYPDGRTSTLEQKIKVDTIGVELPPFSDMCLNHVPLTLNQGTPKGGIYKGAGVDSKASTFTPQLAGAGTFPITYVYTNPDGCVDSVTQNITIQAPQVLTLTPGIDTFCLNSPTVNLNRILPTGGTYLGRGVTSNRFSPLAAGIGIHPITYVSTDLCRSLKTFNLTVSPQGSQLRFSKTVTKNGCGSTVITFTNTSPAGTSGFTWTAGDGTAPVKSRDFVHTYTRTGTYTVVLEGDCGRTASEQIVIAPNGFRFQNDTAICVGERLRLEVGGADKYTWNPSSSLDDLTSPNPLAFPTTTTDYVVKLEKGACIIYDTITVSVLPNPTLDFKADLINGCDSFQKVILKNNAPTDLTFSWQDEAGNTLTRLNETTIESQKPGKLWVYLKTDLGKCSKRDSVFFDIKSNPDYLSLSTTSLKTSSLTSCGKTDPVQLEASGGSTYLWQPTAGLSNSTIPNPIATPTAPTTYTVRITNAAGCTARRSVKVEVLNAPQIEFTIEKTRQVCNQVPEVHFKNETRAAEYLWDFGDGSTSEEQSPVHRYAKGGTYKIKLQATSANACFVDTTFEVQVEEALIYNAFSPNGDGINETLDFGLEGWGVEVYNRWGKLVYESSDYKNDWNGGSLTAGTYYYVLRSPLGYRCRGWVALLK